MTSQTRSDFEGRDAIRCVQQLGMVKLWERLKGDDVLPRSGDVDEHDVERLRDKLMLLDIEWHGDEPRYLIRYQGADFDRMHNRSCVGLFLNDVMAPAVGQRGLKTYREVVSSKRPAFTSTPVRGANSAVVNYERLLLPFTRSGQDVERIYCVVTLFAEDNLSPFAAISGSAPLSRE